MCDITEAFEIRQKAGADLLIIGAGKLCEKEDNKAHKPHPAGCLTVSLPDEAPNAGMSVGADIKADVTETDNFVSEVKKARKKPFKVIHFENIDNTVASDIAALRSADAVLEKNGLLIIQCGNLPNYKDVSETVNFAGFIEEGIFSGATKGRTFHLVNRILENLEMMNYLITYVSTDISIVAKKPGSCGCCCAVQ